MTQAPPANDAPSGAPLAANDRPEAEMTQTSSANDAPSGAPFHHSPLFLVDNGVSWPIISKIAMYNFGNDNEF